MPSWVVSHVKETNGIIIKHIKQYIQLYQCQPEPVPALAVSTSAHSFCGRVMCGVCKQARSGCSSSMSRNRIQLYQCQLEQVRLSPCQRGGPSCKRCNNWPKIRPSSQPEARAHLLQACICAASALAPYISTQLAGQEV